MLQSQELFLRKPSTEPPGGDPDRGSWRRSRLQPQPTSEGNEAQCSCLNCLPRLMEPLRALRLRVLFSGVGTHVNGGAVMALISGNAAPCVAYRFLRPGRLLLRCLILEWKSVSRRRAMMQPRLTSEKKYPNLVMANQDPGCLQNRQQNGIGHAFDRRI